MPPYLRKKAARNVSAKVTLAARIDSFHESLNGDAGQNLLEELEKKFEKWQEPPPVKEVKALPRPDDAPRQKRGGKLIFERELLWTWLIFFHLEIRDKLLRKFRGKGGGSRLTRYVTEKYKIYHHLTEISMYFRYIPSK